MYVPHMCVYVPVTGTYSKTVGATSNDTCAPCNAGKGRFCPLGSSSSAGIWCPAAYYCTGGISDKQACPEGESSFFLSLSLPPSLLFPSLSRALSLHGWHQRLSSVPRSLVLLDGDRCVKCVSVCLSVCASLCLCVDEACEHDALQQGAAIAAARDEAERVGVLTHVGVA
jgi:hypothetical protein